MATKISLGSYFLHKQAFNERVATTQLISKVCERESIQTEQYVSLVQWQKISVLRHFRLLYRFYVTKCVLHHITFSTWFSTSQEFRRLLVFLGVTTNCSCQLAHPHVLPTPYSSSMKGDFFPTYSGIRYPTNQPVEPNLLLASCKSAGGLQKPGSVERAIQPTVAFPEACFCPFRLQWR